MGRFVPLLLAAAGVALCSVHCFVAPSMPPAAPETSGRIVTTGLWAAAEMTPDGQASDRGAMSPIVLGAVLGLLAAVVVGGSRPAMAADLENGAGIFTGNCGACHSGGNNSIVPDKKIKKEALEKYLTGGYNVEAIKTQVTNGKGSMPAFGEKLGPDDIDDVAAYVFDQATKW